MIPRPAPAEADSSAPGPAQALRRPGRPTGRTELALQRISVHLGAQQILHEVTLQCRPGEVLGLVGPNGCGKSTLLRTVFRALVPDEGAVLVGDEDLCRLAYRRSAELIAALPQEERSDLDFTVREVVAMGVRANPSAPGSEDQRVDQALRRTGVAALAHRSILGLSGGERQRVLIARAWAQETPVLVLDEPTNHLDLRHQVQLLRTLRLTSEAAGSRTVGMPAATEPDEAIDPAEDGLWPGSGSPTVLVALHDLNHALAVCDRVALVDHGRIHAAGRPADVLTEDRIEEVYGIRPTLVEHPTTGRHHLLFTL